MPAVRLKRLIQSIERDIQHIVNSARQGDLSQRVDLNGKQGFYAHLGAGINELVESCENIVKDTLRVFEGLSHGSLDETYHSNYQGSFDQVKQNANATIAKLKQVIEGDIQGLVNAAVQGDLSRRIELSDKQAAWPQPLRTLDHTLPADLPDAVVGAIRIGFRRQTKHAQQALRAAAVAGGRATIEQLQRGSGLAGDALDTALDELEWDRWLEADARGYGFVARIVRDVVLRDMVTEGQRARIAAALNPEG